MSIEADIRQWNGKSGHDIRGIYSRYKDQPELSESLVELSADHDLETGATWLLKHHLETSSGTLNSRLSERLIGCGSGFASWEARLHLLQMLDGLEIRDGAVGKLAKFVDACLDDRKTLVRAWSYHGLQHLARLDPSRHADILARLKRAEETEHAASAKVRLRKAIAAVSKI
jgi:hypothetical protein